MAHWIKVEVNTPDKTEITYIADTCQCSHGDAFLAWFRFYAWADSETDDGFLKLLTKTGCDIRAGLKGFADAMEYAGWITFQAGGAQISNWDRHNGKSAKKRMLSAERQRLSRFDRDKSVTHVTKICDKSVTDVTKNCDQIR